MLHEVSSGTVVGGRVVTVCQDCLFIEEVQGKQIIILTS